MTNYLTYIGKGEKDTTKPNEDFVYISPDSSPAVFAVADGYWGSGQEASRLAPVLFHRKLEERLHYKELNQENAKEFLQACIDDANKELKATVSGGYTTLTIAFIHEENLYAFTLGDSVAFGYSNNKGLQLLTEPQTLGYDVSKKWLQAKGSTDDPFMEYCIFDKGKDAPRNFMGLPSIDHPSDTYGEKPIVEAVTIIPVKELETIILTTDGLTSRVLPDEIMHICREANPEDIIDGLVEHHKNPDEIVYHLLIDLYKGDDTQQKIKSFLKEFGIKPEQEPKEIYEALKKKPDVFQKVAQYCLNFPHDNRPMKPLDDMVIVAVELHPKKRPKIYDLRQALKQAETTLKQRNREYAEQEGLVKKLREKNTSLTETNTSLVQRIKAKDDEYRELQKKYRGIEGQYQELENNFRELVNLKNNLEEQLREAENKVKIGHSIRETFKTANEKLTSINRELYANLENAYSKVAELEGELAKKRNYALSLEEKIKKYTTQIKNRRWEKLMYGFVCCSIGVFIGVGTFFASNLINKKYISEEDRINQSTEKVDECILEHPEILSTQADKGKEKKELGADEEAKLTIDVCVIGDDKLGVVIGNKTYGFSKTSNEADFTNEEICESEIFSLNPDIGILFYYVSGTKTKQNKIYADGDHFILHRDASNINLDDILLANINTVFFCDSKFIFEDKDRTRSVCEIRKQFEKYKRGVDGRFNKSIIGSNHEIILPYKTKEALKGVENE